MHLHICLSRFGRTYGSAGPTLPPLATVFPWYTAWWVLMSDGRCRGLVDQFGLLGGPLLHVLRKTRSSATSSMYSSCFLLITDLYSWKDKFSKTTVQLGSWYKYVNKRHSFPSFVSIVDSQILHLTTVNNNLCYNMTQFHSLFHYKVAIQQNMLLQWWTCLIQFTGQLFIE